MADDEDDESGPVVELGEGEPVDGAPLARVSSRQTWGMEKSRLIEREGDTEIRTPDGPQRLGDVLESVDASYFARRQDFEDDVTNVVGTGPVPTANGDATDASDETSADSDSETNTETETDTDGDSDAESDANFDPDPEGDAEARARSQGEAHAETSSESDGDSDTDSEDGTGAT